MWMAEQRVPGRLSNGVITNGDSESITADPEHTEVLTALIVRRTFHLLLQDGGISRHDLLDQFRVDLQRMDRGDAKVVRSVTDSLREVLQNSECTTVPATVRDFERRDWPLSEEIICTEFHRVSKELIEETNWGRMITFLLFAVSFSIFALQQGMPDATVTSIHGWTVEALRSTPTSTFIVTHDGWEGFVDYLATLLKRSRRRRAPLQTTRADQPDQPDSPFWTTMAVGAIGLGVAVAFGVRQALS